MVFRDFVPGATGEDIARTLEDLAPLQLGRPLGISLIMDAAGQTSAPCPAEVVMGIFSGKRSPSPQAVLIPA